MSVKGLVFFEKGMVIEMDGSILGNLAGIGYFLAYQAAGLFISFLVLKEEDKAVRILLGSVFGSVLLQWMPVVFSFGLGFNRGSHVAALIMTIVLIVAFSYFWKKKMGKAGMQRQKAQNFSGSVWQRVWKEYAYFLVVLPLFFGSIVYAYNTICGGRKHSYRAGYLWGYEYAFVLYYKYRKTGDFSAGIFSASRDKTFVSVFM